MPAPLLAIIAGPPCTGKTTLGLRLAEEFRLPFVNKDGIKEMLFDRLGWKDREWSKLLGLASYDLLYHFLELQLRAGGSLIAESNFRSEIDTPRLLALKSRTPFHPFQIQCRTAGQVLAGRFKRRSESGERHPGHVDHLNYAELQESLLKGEYEPLAIGGDIFTVDTTDFATLDNLGLSAALADALKAARRS